MSTVTVTNCSFKPSVQSVSYQFQGWTACDTGQLVGNVQVLNAQNQVISNTPIVGGQISKTPVGSGSTFIWDGTDLLCENMAMQTPTGMVTGRTDAPSTVSCSQLPNGGNTPVVPNNSTSSFFSQHKVAILSGVAIFIFLCIIGIIVLVMIHRRRSNRSE